MGEVSDAIINALRSNMPGRIDFPEMPEEKPSYVPTIPGPPPSPEDPRFPAGSFSPTMIPGASHTSELDRMIEAAGRGEKRGRWAEQFIQEAAATDPQTVGQAVATAVDNMPEGGQKTAALDAIASARRPTTDEIMERLASMSPTLDLVKPDIDAILSSVEGPKKPELLDSEDMMMRILFGLAQGVAMGTRGYSDENVVARMLAGGGAGALGGLIEGKEQNREAKAEYEKQYQGFRERQQRLEIELTDRANEIELMKARVEQEQYMKEFDVYYDEIKRLDPEIHVTESGYITMYKDGTVISHFDPAMFESKLMQALISLEVMQRFQTSPMSIRRGAHNEWLRAGLPPEYAPAADAAYAVVKLGIGDPDLAAKVEQDILSADKVLEQQVLRGGDESVAARQLLETRAMVKIMGFFASNPDKLKEFHEQYMSAEELSRLYIPSPPKE